MAETSVVTLQRTEKYSSYVAEELMRMKEEQTFMDFTIQIGDQCLPCHKLVLGAHSPVLKLMLTCDLHAEVTQQAVRLDKISVDTMKLILDYMYSGTVSMHKEQVLDTLTACDFLQMEEMRELCIAQAPSVIIRANVISWWKLSIRIGLDDITSHCESFIVADFLKVSRQSNFLAMEPAELKQCLADVCGEQVQSDDMLDATMRWVAEDEDERLEQLEDIMHHFDVDKCSLYYIKATMKSYAALLDREPKVYKLLSNALAGISTTLLTASTNPSPTSPALLLIGGRNDEINRACWQLQESCEVEKHCDVPYRIRQHSICKTPLGFLVTGGNVCTMFIAATKSWARMQNMLNKRIAHGSICTRGLILVLGGWQEGEESKSVHQMEIEDGGWEEAPDLLVASRFPKVAQLDDTSSLFVMDEGTLQLQHLDLDSKEWSMKASLPLMECRACSMVSAGGHLFLAGRVLARYTPATDTWSFGPPPLHVHIYGSLVHLGDKKLALLGGCLSSGTDEVEEYDMSRGVWSVSSRYRMPASLYLHQALLVDIPQ